MKMKNFKLFGLALSGVLSMTCLTGCESYPQKYNEEKGCVFTKQFDIGEHIVSVPLDYDVREKNEQITSFPGYEVVGVSYTAYGGGSYYGGGVVVYSNNEVVECESSIYDENGEYVYLDIGTPLDYEEQEVLDDEEICEFDVGEHILLVPIVDDVRDDIMQYEYHEGYEVMGISITAYGNGSYYGGGSIIYKNNVPVRAKLQEEGYTDFGEVITKELGRGLN